MKVQQTADGRRYYRADDHASIAKRLGMSTETYLQQKSRGKIGLRAVLLDPTRVIFEDEIAYWETHGRPYENVHQEVINRAQVANKI